MDELVEIRRSRRARRWTITIPWGEPVLLTVPERMRERDIAVVIEAHPIALQLRYLQTLLELGSSQSTTIAFPVPIEMLKAFAAYGDK